MYKQLIFLHNADRSYAFKRFEEEARKLNYKFIPININYFKCNFLEEISTFIDLNDANYNDSIVIIRNLGGEFAFNHGLMHLLLRFLKEKGAKVLNYDSLIKFPFHGDKLLQTNTVSNLKVGITIDTWFFNSYVEIQKVLYPLLDQNVRLIAKPRIGSHGDGISIINDKYHLETFLMKNNPSSFLFQKFIENDFDIRVFITKDGILGSMKRQRKEGFINNFSRGADISEFDFGDSYSQVENISKKILNLLEAEYLGIDFIYNENTKSLKFLEYNRFCEFKGFERVTNINIADRIINLATH